MTKRPRKTRRPRRDRSEPARGELLSRVCAYFAQGLNADAIVERMRLEHGAHISREEPWRLVAEAFARKMLRFVAPVEQQLTDRLSTTFPWIQRVHVVHSAVAADVALHGANIVVDLVTTRSRLRRQRTLHVGLAGGGILEALIRNLGGMLLEAELNALELPKALRSPLTEIIFHSMVGNLGRTRIPRDPATLFGYLGADPLLRNVQTNTGFVSLPAPAVVETKDFEFLKRLDGIRDALAARDELDIIVTSAGHWRVPSGPPPRPSRRRAADEAGHSALFRLFYERSRSTVRKLEAAGCVGDMMWGPIGPKGPLEIATDKRAVTLMSLGELPGFIAKGKDVVLVLGPCGNCGQPKVEVLEVLLRLRPEERLLTHLVVDSVTAAALLRRLAVETG